MSLQVSNDYEEQKQIAIEAWNTNAEINEDVKNYKEQYKENQEQAAKTFFKAMNNMITVLFNEGKVQSINQALMIVCADLQESCNKFPKTKNGLKPYVDEENTKRLLQNMVRQPEIDVVQEIIEQSSTNEEQIDTEEQDSNEVEETEQPTLTVQTLQPLTDMDLFDNLFYSPRPYDVWNFKLDSTFGLEYPGNIPAGLVFNTLYFFTKIGDKVVDPMAGGGVVGDCCKEVKRQCLMYDIHSIRPEIQKYDIIKGLPKEAENADLVFWDPPYYKKKEEDYENPGSIASMSRDEYLKIFRTAAEDFYEKGVKKIAFLMSDYDDEYNNNSKDNIFIWDYIKEFSKHWRVHRRIQCPLSPEQMRGSTVTLYKEQKKLGRITRDLIIFFRK